MDVGVEAITDAVELKQVRRQAGRVHRQAIALAAALTIAAGMIAAIL